MLEVPFKGAPLRSNPLPRFGSTIKDAMLPEFMGATKMLVEISDPEASEQAFRDDERRFRDIFEYAGVAVWEQDFSGVAELLKRFRSDGIEDLRAFLAAHPERLDEAIARVRIIDVNPFTVELFEATEKGELLRSLTNVFLPETAPIFMEELIAIWEGRRRFGSDTVLRTLRGRRLDVVFTITFEGSHHERAYVSILDISQRKAAERRLEAVDRIAKAIASNLDLDRIVQTVTDAATEITGAKFGAFFYNLVDPQGERYTLYALSGAPRARLSRNSICLATPPCSSRRFADWVLCVRTISVSTHAMASRRRISACRKDICRSSVIWPFRWFRVRAKCMVGCSSVTICPASLPPTQRTR